MLRIALAQVNVTVGDLEGNYKKIAEYIKRARQLSVDIVVFPELAITGYPPEDLLLKKHFVRDNLKALKALIKKTKNITAIVGFADTDKKGDLFNAAAVLHDRQLKGIYRKVVLPDYGVFDEKRYFSAGQSNAVFKIGPTIFGVTICEDMRAPQGPFKQQAKTGACILINLSCSPYHAGKGLEREKLLQRRAKENNVFVCYANLVGGQDELVFDGGSAIYGPDGTTIATGKQFEEDLVVADIEATEARQLTKMRRLKTVSLEKSHKIPGRLPIYGRVREQMHPSEEIYSALVLGTRDYVLKNGFSKVVVGLSGGVDSSLVAAIACDALGNNNVVGVTMPSYCTSSATKSDAKKLAKNLKIRCIEIPIKSVYSSYLQLLKKTFAGRKPGVAEENLQARIRGNILMALSNKFGWLVLTTGNKSEIAVGYCTLYGDMAGGFAVIKDVPKTKVYELAHLRNIQEGKAIIPQSVLKRAPTAELKKNQKDQDSLPPYDVLDAILEDYIELDKSLAQMRGKKGIKKLIKDVINMVDLNEYKRRQAPPGIKITPRAFGKDRRLPITNSYREC